MHFSRDELRILSKALESHELWLESGRAWGFIPIKTQKLMLRTKRIQQWIKDELKARRSRPKEYRGQVG